MQSGVLVRYLMTLIEVMKADYAVDAETIWQHAGLVPLPFAEEGGKVSIEYADKLWLTASELSGPLLGLKVGAAIQSTSYAGLGHLLVTCETVGDALQVIADNAHYVGAGHFLLQKRHDQLQLEYKLGAEHPVSEMRAVASLLPFSTLAHVVANDVLPCKVWLQMPKPENVSLYEEYFGVPVSFDAGSSGVAWDNSVLKAPMQGANAALNELLLKHIKTELHQADTLSGKVLKILKEAIDIGEPDRFGTLNLEYCANILSMSRRSLQRALAGEGSSFRGLLKTVRQEKAEYYLKHSLRPIAQISALLGYSEPAAFVRAFGAWHKVSPSKFRMNCKNVI